MVVFGFLDGILLIKMPSGQPSIIQSAPLCSSAGMLGYNPAEVANRFKQTQIMLQHCCPAGKKQLPGGTLQPLLFIRKISQKCESGFTAKSRSIAEGYYVALLTALEK